MIQLPLTTTIKIKTHNKTPSFHCWFGILFHCCCYSSFEVHDSFHVPSFRNPVANEILWLIFTTVQMYLDDFSDKFSFLDCFYAFLLSAFIDCFDNLYGTRVL